MKVLFITRKYPPQVGGMENFSYSLIKNIKCEKTVVALKRSNVNLIWFLPYIMLYSLINARKYEVIHLGDMVLSGLGWLIKLIYPEKVVITTVHGLDITYSLPIYQWYIKVFGNRCDKYICNSKNTEELAHKIGIKETSVIHMGIEIHKFDGVNENKEKFKEKYAIPSNNTVFITTGRLVRRKGVLWFLENVMPNYRYRNITYLIVGVGDDYNAIEEAINNKGLNEQVRLLGRIDDEELNSLYVNADIFIMPNIIVENDVEGFGIVAIEAGLSQNIVIASNIEGIKDSIYNWKNGILVNSGDINAYINIIDNVIENIDKYSEFAIEASEFTKDNYSWRNICKLYLNEFNNTMKSKYNR